MPDLPLPPTSSTDAEARATIAMLPVGSFEQHGAHMPLATDTLIAVAVANAVAARTNTNGLVVRQLPPVTIACSHEHVGFAGTVSISATTLAAIVTDIAESLAQQGVEQLIVVNGHGGNYVLANVVQQANAARPGAMALFPHRDDWADARTAAGMTTNASEDMHAGELEGSILLAAWPHYLQDEWTQAWVDDDHTTGERRDLHTLGMSAYTTTGIIGRPSLATEAKGQAALQSLGEAGTKVIETLTKLSPRH